MGLNILKSKYCLINFYITFLSSLILLLIIFTFVNLFNFDKLLIDYLGVHIILLSGIVISSFYMPLSLTFILSGNPNINFYMTLSLMIINIFFSLLLIPIFSIYGAAMSTSLMNLSYIFIIKYFTNKTLKLKI